MKEDISCIMINFSESLRNELHLPPSTLCSFLLKEGQELLCWMEAYNFSEFVKVNPGVALALNMCTHLHQSYIRGAEKKDFSKCCIYTFKTHIQRGLDGWKIWTVILSILIQPSPFSNSYRNYKFSY